MAPAVVSIDEETKRPQLLCVNVNRKTSFREEWNTYIGIIFESCLVTAQEVSEGMASLEGICEVVELDFIPSRISREVILPQSNICKV